MTALTSQDNIARLADTFTSKVTADDISNTDDKLHDFLVEFAAEYVNSYTGTFAFMLNMRGWVNFGLSDAQVAGVVNCALNDYRHAQRQAAVQAAQEIVTAPTTPARTFDLSHQYVADGWYTIQGNTSHRTVRLQTVKEDGNTVKQWLAYLNGSDNTGDYLTIGFVIGNEVKLFKKNEGKYTDIVAAARYLIKNGTKAPEYGKNYALRSGRCARCNKMLTVPLSITNGYGPKCSEAMGL